MLQNTVARAKSLPFGFRDKVEKKVRVLGWQNGHFHIEEFCSMVDLLEQDKDLPFVRMDFGVPGLSPLRECLDGHQMAIITGHIPRGYPPHSGASQLKDALASFISKRLNNVFLPENVFVTCGATQALFVAQLICARRHPDRNTIALLTPIYPPVEEQARCLGLDIVRIELDGKKGPVLLQEIERVFEQHKITSLCWASPNNPSWRVFEHEELSGIASLCERHDVIPIEDLTYLGMVDPKNALLKSGFPSISVHTDRSFVVLSASKMLSYAGERIGFLASSSTFMNESSLNVKQSLSAVTLGRACGSLVFNLTAGAPHSAQHAIAAVLSAINDNRLDLEAFLSEYAIRAKRLKQMLERHGFYFIYDNDNTEELDGFYVCFGYPGLSGIELVRKLLHIGVTVLPLSLFGSERVDGVRACVGRVDESSLMMLEERMAYFEGR